jgi:hypothetical protein
VKVEEKKKEEKKEEKKKEEKKEEKKKEEKKMPVTGGVDLSLIGLMAGALLAAGGLLVRRIIR